jgi:arylsulfatase A-like enzyme
VYQVELPEDARLDLGLAVRVAEARAWGEGLQLRGASTGRVACRVVVELEDGTRAVVLDEELPRNRRDRYQDHRIDLSPWSGELVRLHLQCDAPPGLVDGWTGFVAWAEPVVWSAAPDSRPSVILVLLDTLRADRLGCHGWERARTPRLDALAASGVRYDQAMSASSWTLPAHASLFTSSYPSQHGLWSDQRLPDPMTTLAEAMARNGYRTAAFTERGFVKADHGFARGFERLDSASREAEVTFDLAARWIEDQTGPTFTFVHTYKVHSPYDPAERFREGIVRPYEGDLPRDIDVREHSWGRNGAPPSEDDQRYVSDLYDAEVAEVDHALGVFLDRLEAGGRLEDTLLIVTSDHGEEFFEHGHTLHGLSLYQEQLHIPLIVHRPGHIDGGRVVEQPVHLVDIAPTVLVAAGIPVPGDWVGVPLDREPAPGARPLLSSMLTYWAGPRHRGEQAIAVREGELLYVDYPAGLRPHDPISGPALFDVRRDPLQQQDLLHQGGAGEWAARAEALLERFPPVGRAESVEVDEATSRELRGLGYVGGDE